jgi:hypothetical protein
MKKAADPNFRKCALSLLFALCSLPSAWAGVYQHGTVIRMRMGDCLPAHHGFMVAFGAPAGPMAVDACPEYTLVADKVVFVIVGSSGDQIVPLADVIDFRFHKNELAMRIDDARRESKFTIREMILRSEWDMMQRHITEQMNAASHASETSMALRTRD